MHQVGLFDISFKTRTLASKPLLLPGCEGSLHPTPCDPRRHDDTTHHVGGALGVASLPESVDTSPDNHVIGAAGVSDSGGEDGQGNGIMTESEKRRDKRRRYRRRKRDRDLQEELLVRQQHVIHPSASSTSTSNHTTTTANTTSVSASPSPSSSAGDKAENAKVPAPKKPYPSDSSSGSRDVSSGTACSPQQPRLAVSTSPTTTATFTSKAAAAAAPPLPTAQKQQKQQQQPIQQQQQPASGHAPRGLAMLVDPQLPYGHGQGQGVGHNPEREDCSSWHFAPDHYDMTRPLYVRVCGLKAAVHIDSSGVIWLNLSQLMKLVGKTKKQ